MNRTMDPVQEYYDNLPEDEKASMAPENIQEAYKDVQEALRITNKDLERALESNARYVEMGTRCSEELARQELDSSVSAGAKDAMVQRITQFKKLKGQTQAVIDGYSKHKLELEDHLKTITALMKHLNIPISS